VAFSRLRGRFQRVNKAAVNDTEALCWIRGHVDGMNRTDYIFHPAIMDAVFQVSTVASDDDFF
jgi:fatty acid synthase, animal type